MGCFAAAEGEISDVSYELMGLHNVSKTFGGVVALRDVSLSLRRGEIHCVAGQNGSGKSTLIKVMSGVHRPNSGTITIDGGTTPTWTPRAAIEAGVQVIYQDFALFGNLTVAENLAVSTLLHEGRGIVNRKRVFDIAQQAVEGLGVTLDLHCDVSKLSVSGKQLVAIGRALMSSPRLLIMDEPTAALTGHEIEILLRVVREIRSRGVTVVFISHKTQEVLDISDRVTVLRNGAVVASGEVAEFDEASIARAVTGVEHRPEPFRYGAENAGPPRLEVRKLSLAGHLHEIDLSIGAGEIVGLCGLLGSGRTELALTLFGMRPGHTGEVWIDGRPADLRSVQAAVKHGIGYVPEDRLSEGLFFDVGVAENILAAEIGAATALRLDRRKAQAEALAMQARMQIAGSGERPVQQLSGGNQQRVVLGRWLLTKPRILVLNGPTVGVDIGAKATIHKVIRGLAEQGLGVLIISDDIPELLENCNRLITVHDGRVVEILETEDIHEEDVNSRLRAFK
jgi:simple sugar transport system ATP-binding protein